MNERERADWLARTIDDILRGKRQTTLPEGFDENDVSGLLRAASTRMSQRSDSAKSSLQYEGAVWRQVLRRLDRRRQPRTTSRTDGRPGGSTHQSRPPDTEVAELIDIVSIRRKLTDEMMSISESRRADVWHKLEPRLGSKPRKKGWLSFLRRPFTRADPLSPALDSIPLNAPLAEVDRDSGNPRATALARKSGAADDMRDHLWNRIRTSVEQESTCRSDSRHQRSMRPRWALAVAASVVVVAISLPIFGVSHQPVVEAARYVGSYLGVTETNSSPPKPSGGDSVAIDPVDISAAEATVLLGVKVAEPRELTEFELTSSQFFSQPVTANTGGTFVLTYQGREPTQSLVIYQEVSSGTNLATGSDSATSITLPGGTPGTYIDGAWQVNGTSGLSWDIGGTQTLVFERDGVRTIIRYTGPRIDTPALIAIADMMG